MDGEKLNKGTEKEILKAENPKDSQEDFEQQGLARLDKIIMETEEVEAEEDSFEKDAQNRINILKARGIAAETGLETTLNSMIACEGEINSLLRTNLNRQELLETALASIKREEEDPATVPTQEEQRLNELAVKLIELHKGAKGYAKKIEGFRIAIERIKIELRGRKAQATTS